MGTMLNFVIPLSFLIKFTEPLSGGFARVSLRRELNKRLVWCIVVSDRASSVCYIRKT